MKKKRAVDASQLGLSLDVVDVLDEMFVDGSPPTANEPPIGLLSAPPVPDPVDGGDYVVQHKHARRVNPDDVAPTIMQNNLGQAQILIDPAAPLSRTAPRAIVSADAPAPTIMHDSVGTSPPVNFYRYAIESAEVCCDISTEPPPSKPPYRIPLMSEIAATPKNGLTMVSTFSGCGGSCLGFKMAGFDVLWANEFVPAAQATYRANHPSTYLDERDIRTVTAASIRERVGDRPIDVLEGSPPCASFSTAGKTSKGWGEVRKYSDTKQRTDDLFLQFLRLLDELRPRAFVAENVSGMTKGVSKGYFKRFLDAFLGLPYRVECRLLDAQYLGVPQRRVRLIFVGIRNDVVVPSGARLFPTKLPYTYSVRDAIPWIAAPSVSMKIGGQEAVGDNVGASLDGYSIGDEWDKLKVGETSEKYFNLVKTDPDQPCQTVTAAGAGNPGGTAAIAHPYERRKFTLAELRRICGFPDDFVLTGTYAQAWERLGRAVPPPMMRAVAECVREILK